MEKNVFINGSLYLKRKPSINPTSYKGLSCIHQLVISEDGFFLRKRSFTGDYYDIIPIEPQVLKEDYIDFMQFLKGADYIGKVGQMTQPSIGGDVSFMIRKPIVLYRGKEHIVLYHGKEDFSKLMYWDNLPVSVLDYRYMDSWKYMTEEKNDYNDPKKLYSDLLKEVFGILNKDPQDKKKRK